MKNQIANQKNLNQQTREEDRKNNNRYQQFVIHIKNIFFVK